MTDSPKALKPNKLRELRAYFAGGPATVVMAKADALAVLEIIEKAQYSTEFLLQALRDRQEDEGIRPHLLMIPTTIPMAQHTNCLINSVLRLAKALGDAGFSLDCAHINCMQEISPADFHPDDESENQPDLFDLASAAPKGIG